MNREEREELLTLQARSARRQFATSPVADYAETAQDIVESLLRAIGHTCKCTSCEKRRVEAADRITTALQSTAAERDAEIERLRHHLRGAIASIKVNDVGQPIGRACPWTLDWYAAASAELDGQGFDAQPQFEKSYEVGTAFAKSVIEDLKSTAASARQSERERDVSLCGPHRNEYTKFIVGGCVACWLDSAREAEQTRIREAIDALPRYFCEHGMMVKRDLGAYINGMELLTAIAADQ